ncbi:hypothetical protein FRC03_000749 [Tulasnella sp. 419]|nr:hypothetical protein FRC02_000867 [Tulasnella sp. 418]KAG8965284.1 hypothetical protein FRC03_000749 [Tulasnella sp. 419]
MPAPNQLSSMYKALSYEGQPSFALSPLLTLSFCFPSQSNGGASGLHSMQFPEMLDTPPYYYIKAHPSTAGQWLPILRVSYSGAGFPSMYVRALQPGDYRHPWRQAEVEQAYVQRIDYNYVARALESRQVQFIRPVYPPHVPNEMDGAGRPKILDAPLHQPQNPAHPHTSRSVRRSASIAFSHSATILPPMLTGPSMIANHPTPQPRRQMSTMSVRESRIADGLRIQGIPVIDEGRVPVSPVLSDSTSSSSSSGALSTSTSTSQSSFNLSRSALNHYVSAQRSRERSHKVASTLYHSDLSDVHSTGETRYNAPPMILPAGPTYRVSAPHASFPSSIPTHFPPATPGAPGLRRQRTGRGTDPVSYHEDEGPIYSSYELYNPPERFGVSSSMPRFVKQSHNDPSPQLTGSAYGSGLGIGAGPGWMHGQDRDRQGLKGKKWWKMGL